MNDNLNNQETKEGLLELLKGYRGVLTEHMLDYLNSLIELEFSVMKEYISDSDRKVLAELEIYKKIAIYNIYNRTQNLFNQQKGEFIISGDYDGWYVSAKLNDRSVELFNYMNVNGCGFFEIPSGFKNLNIGDVSLFQTLENKELREASLDSVKRTLEKLNSEQNPWLFFPDTLGGQGPAWEVDHARKIQHYKKLLKQLNSRKELGDEDKREIEITRQIHDLLLDDFGLTSESFTDKINQSFVNLSNGNTELKKIRIKRMPNLTITDKIKYI